MIDWQLPQTAKGFVCSVKRSEVEKTAILASHSNGPTAPQGTQTYRPVACRGYDCLSSQRSQAQLRSEGNELTRP